jgi:hypothetical protein
MFCIRFIKASKICGIKIDDDDDDVFSVLGFDVLVIVINIVFRFCDMHEDGDC